MSSVTKPWKSFFTYPFTWLATALTAGLHIAFVLVLQPPLLWSLLAFGLDAAALAAWFVFAFKSKDFRKRLNRMPYEDRGKEVSALIQRTPDRFKKPAQEALRLIQKINAEFPGKSYSYELEMMLLNIHELSKNHAILWERSQDFGDAAQKKKMDSILTGQVEAVNNALATLKTFSGNLTLLEANEEQSQAATGELKDINEGLKEVIKEI